jgi:hypothetical protein
MKLNAQRYALARELIEAGHVHRCAVLAVESRAGQYDYLDTENAAAHLHGMLETLKQGTARG